MRRLMSGCHLMFSISTHPAGVWNRTPRSPWWVVGSCGDVTSEHQLVGARVVRRVGRLRDSALRVGRLLTVGTTQSLVGFIHPPCGRVESTGWLILSGWLAHVVRFASRHRLVSPRVDGRVGQVGVANSDLVGLLTVGPVSVPADQAGGPCAARRRLCARGRLEPPSQGSSSHQVGVRPSATPRGRRLPGSGRTASQLGDRRRPAGRPALCCRPGRPA